MLQYLPDHIPLMYDAYDPFIREKGFRYSQSSFTLNFACECGIAGVFPFITASCRRRQGQSMAYIPLVEYLMFPFIIYYLTSRHFVSLSLTGIKGLVHIPDDMP